MSPSRVCCCRVQSCPQFQLLWRGGWGVPRQVDGVTAPQGLAVDLALLRRKKRLCICGLSPGRGCDSRDLWAGWRLFVEHSEIPMWKELMKDEIITQSCQHWHREGFGSMNAHTAALDSPCLSFSPHCCFPCHSHIPRCCWQGFALPTLGESRSPGPSVPEAPPSPLQA